MKLETVALVAVAAVAFVMWQRSQPKATAPGAQPGGGGRGSLPPGGGGGGSVAAPNDPGARLQQLGGRFVGAARAGLDAAFRPDAIRTDIALGAAGAGLGGTVGGAVGTGLGSLGLGFGAAVGAPVGTAVGAVGGAAAGVGAGMMVSGGKAAAETFFAGGGWF